MSLEEKKALLREDYIRQYVAQQKTIKRQRSLFAKILQGENQKWLVADRSNLTEWTRWKRLNKKEIKPHFKFPAAPLTTTEHLRVKHLDVGYHYPVLSDINFSVKGGEKVVITGFNGIGSLQCLKLL